MYRVECNHEYLPWTDELFLDWEDVKEMKEKFEKHGYEVTVTKED